MSSDVLSILVGETWRRVGMVAKASGSPITSGTVNYYLKALSGTNAGKWWKNADQTWAATETSNTMVHQADGSWTITLAASPFASGILYLEYAKESGDLHVAAEGRLLRGKATVDSVNIIQVSGDTQSLADLKDLADTGYNPSTHKVQGVVLVDTCAINSDMRGTNNAALETTLTAIKGEEWTDETLVSIQAAMEATGTGANTVTITVDDGTDPLENAKVRVTSGAESYVGTTNASGVATFALDNATWTVVITKPLYVFTSTTLAVSAETSHTYSMTAISVDESDPGQVTGYLYAYDEEGQPEEGVSIALWLVTPPASGTGSAYDVAVRTEMSDANGLVQFTGLFPGVTYTWNRGTSAAAYRTTIPAGTTGSYALTSGVGTP